MLKIALVSCLAPGMIEEHRWIPVQQLRGGAQQRAALLLQTCGHQPAIQAAEAQHPRIVANPKCPLAVALLSLVAWGFLFPSTASWLAREAQKSGCSTDSIKKLSTIGNSGESAQNSRRDLFARFFKDIIVPRPLKLNAHLLDTWQRPIRCDIEMTTPLR